MAGRKSAACCVCSDCDVTLMFRLVLITIVCGELSSGQRTTSTDRCLGLDNDSSSFSCSCSCANSRLMPAVVEELQAQLTSLRQQILSVEQRLTSQLIVAPTPQPSTQRIYSSSASTGQPLSPLSTSATNTSSVGRTCTLELRSWAYGDASAHNGYIKANGVDLLTTPRSNEYESAMGVVVIDPATSCNATRSTPSFYVTGTDVDATSFSDFLRRLPVGAVVAGVSSCTICQCCGDCNNAARATTNAAFAAVGINVTDVGATDKLSFVAVIGSAGTKIVDKRSSSPALMTVTVQATAGGVALNRID